MHRIVLITPGQPSSNPRLLKEAITLNRAGYDVTVIYNFWVDWADGPDERLFREYPSIRWIRVGGHPVRAKWRYWYTRLRHKLSRTLAGVLSGSDYWKEQSQARAGFELERAAKRVKADLYIAHNLAALRPAARAAAKHRGRYAFDGEDFHRGQETSGSVAYTQTVHIEDRYLPGAAYVTAASPLIGAAYRGLYPGMEPVVVNNVFFKEYLQPPPVAFAEGDVLKLFWFSQTVGHGRGLEELILAMGAMKGVPVMLTVLGACSAATEGEFRAMAAGAGLEDAQLHFHAPVTLEEIFPIAHAHHVGMALELKSIFNRNICLTNKIFTYLLSGNYIVATDTDAQKLFLAAYPGIGVVYPEGDHLQLAHALIAAAGAPLALNEARQRARELGASRMNWEAEQNVFLQQIQSILPSR